METAAIPNGAQAIIRDNARYARGAMVVQRAKRHMGDRHRVLTRPPIHNLGIENAASLTLEDHLSETSVFKGMHVQRSNDHSLP